MKKYLSAVSTVLVCMTLAGPVAGQERIKDGNRINRGTPVSSPEPATILALAGGAAAAAGIAYRKRKRSK